MKVIIVEDETPAADKLERYIRKYNDEFRVVARLQSVQETIAWLRSHQEEIDLIFMDVQLNDGLSFQVFQHVAVRKPVIFTTAYNEFALDAFKVNTIDYLLKPITFTDLTASLDKLSTLRSELSVNNPGIARMHETLSPENFRSYKSRFMVKLGEHIRSITSDQISVFYADGRDVYLVTSQGKKFIIDYTLESLDGILDPATFFRINRTFIININSVKDVIVYTNSRLKIVLTIDIGKEIIVSREKVNEFKDWFDGGTPTGPTKV